MSESFRVESSEVRAWHAAVAARANIRGVAAIAKEMESRLGKVESDEHVVLTRYQLFTWAEALEGAAARDPQNASSGGHPGLAQIATDLRATLGATAPTAAKSKPVTAALRNAPPPSPAAPVYPPTSVAPATNEPAIRYRTPGSAPASSGGTGSVRFLSGGPLTDETRRLLAGARQEVCIVTPWGTGLETLVDELARLPREVTILIVSRQPPQQETSFHRGMDTLGRRNARTVWSPHIQTRSIIIDGRTLMQGAAALHADAFPSRETALVTTEAAIVNAAREHFKRIHQEGGGSG